MTAALTFPRVAFDEYHQSQLPARIAAGNGPLAADDVADVAPIAAEAVPLDGLGRRRDIGP